MKALSKKRRTRRLSLIVIATVFAALTSGCLTTDEYGVSVDQSNPPRLAGGR